MEASKPLRLEQKEIRKVAEGLIAMAVKKRKDNFETVTVTAKVAC